MYEYNSRWYPRKITKEEYDYIKIIAQKYEIESIIILNILKRLIKYNQNLTTNYLLEKIKEVLNKNLKISNNDNIFTLKEFCLTYKFNYEDLLYTITRVKIENEKMDDITLINDSLKHFYNSYQYGKSKYYYPFNNKVITSKDITKEGLISKDNLYNIYSKINEYDYSNAEVLKLINDILNYNFELNNKKIDLNGFCKINKISIKYALYYILLLKLNDDNITIDECFRKMVLNFHNLKDIYYVNNTYKDKDLNKKREGDLYKKRTK